MELKDNGSHEEKLLWDGEGERRNKLIQEESLLLELRSSVT